MPGNYSELLQDVRTAFAEYASEKSRQSNKTHLNYFKVLESKVLYSISVYRESEIDFLKDLNKIIGDR